MAEAKKSILKLPPQGKSKFVTILAWISIITAGFTTFSSLIQNILASSIFPAIGREQLSCNSEVTAYMPAILLFLISHIRFIFCMYFIVSAVTLVSSIGLLKRKNWARILFISILAMGIIWSLGGLFFQGKIMRAVIPEVPAYDDFPGVMSNFQAVFMGMRIFLSMMAVIIVIFYGWIIKKLVSKEIKKEFILAGQ